MKKFKGFTPNQQYTLLTKLGYQGPNQQDDMDKFLMATPSAAMKLGEYALMAQKRLSNQTGMAEGGVEALNIIDDIISLLECDEKPGCPSRS